MLTAIVGVVVLLGGLIFFHELGHFLVAKSFGVKVEVFSLGFGKKLLKKVWGETEYCVSLFPLGGYVKLMGDDPYKEVPSADAHRAFSTQKLYKRFLIVAAGPLANLLLAYVLYVIVFWAGQPVAAARIGHVKVDSTAWSAGLRPQDLVTEIGGEKVQSWRDLEEALKNRSGSELTLSVSRDGNALNVPVKVTQVPSRNEYGEDVMVGGIEGISLLPLASKVGISNPGSPAHQAGLRTGDIVTKVNADNVSLFVELQAALERAWQPGAQITLTVRRPETLDSQAELSSMPEKSFSLTVPRTGAKAVSSPFGAGEALGLYPSEVFVAKIHPDSPAEAGGMQPGDRIMKIGDQPAYHFQSIVDYVERRGKAGEQAELTIERDGKPQLLRLTPKETTTEDPLTRAPVTKYLVGFSSMTAFHEPPVVTFRVRSPGALLSKAFQETFGLAERMVISIGKLVMGQISVKNLGGPVLIASVAGKSLHAGIIPFLQMMALISVNLFLLNLFPIPVLDGGHLLFFTIEAIQRKPVSIRTMEIANQMGMVFILLLVGLTLFNDISRMVLN